jgi:hypothetical protein
VNELAQDGSIRWFGVCSVVCQFCSESHLMPDMLLSKGLLSDHSPYYFSDYIFVLELLRRNHLSLFPV